MHCTATTKPAVCYQCILIINPNHSIVSVTRTPSQSKSRQAVTKFLRTFEEKSHFYCLYASRGFYLSPATGYSIFFFTTKNTPNMKTTSIKPNTPFKEKEISYPWTKPCRLLEHCGEAELGFLQHRPVRAVPAQTRQLPAQPSFRHACEQKTHVMTTTKLT